MYFYFFITLVCLLMTLLDIVEFKIRREIDRKRERDANLRVNVNQIIMKKLNTMERRLMKLEQEPCSKPNLEKESKVFPFDPNTNNKDTDKDKKMINLFSF